MVRSKGNQQLLMRMDDPERIGRAEARHTRLGRVALWVIAVAAVVIAVQVS